MANTKNQITKSLSFLEDLKKYVSNGDVTNLQPVIAKHRLGQSCTRSSVMKMGILKKGFNGYVWNTIEPNTQMATSFLKYKRMKQDEEYNRGYIRKGKEDDTVLKEDVKTKRTSIERTNIISIFWGLIKITNSKF